MKYSSSLRGVWAIVAASSVVFVLTAIWQPTAIQAELLPLVGGVYPRLSGGTLSYSAVRSLPSGIILECGEIKITQHDLDADIRKAPAEDRPQLKRNLFFLLQNKIARTLLAYEAGDWAKQNKKPVGNADDLINSYLSSLATKLNVSDDECRAYYEQNKVSGDTFEQARDQIRERLLDQKRQDAISEHISTLGQRFLISVDSGWMSKQYSAAMSNPVDQARDSGKPTLADFGADWCGPCRMMKPILDQLKKDYAGKLNVVVVDADKEQVLAARFDTSSIPVQVFFDKNGEIFFRHVGFLSRQQIDEKLAAVGVK